MNPLLLLTPVLYVILKREVKGWCIYFSSLRLYGFPWKKLEEAADEESVKSSINSGHLPVLFRNALLFNLHCHSSHSATSCSKFSDTQTPAFLFQSHITLQQSSCYFTHCLIPFRYRHLLAITTWNHQFYHTRQPRTQSVLFALQGTRNLQQRLHYNHM